MSIYNDYRVSLKEAYDLGYEQGYNDGYKQGKKDAIKVAKWVNIGKNSHLGHPLYKCLNCGHLVGVVKGFPKYCSDCGYMMESE